MILRTILLSLVLAGLAWADSIRVGAAISLKSALADIANQYKAKTGEHVDFSFGSSGQILAQVRSGAEIDLFISAANKQVDDLAKEKLIDPATRRVVVTNQLVLIVRANAQIVPTGFADLGAAGVRQIAVGEPKTVPAGQYAQQVLKSLKLTDAVADKLVYGTNVRQVLTYVERGEVDAGIVYLTDAKESGEKIHVVATADAATHEPIVYPGVVIAGTKKADAAKQFLAYLATPEAQAVFSARGFAIPAHGDKGNR